MNVSTHAPFSDGTSRLAARDPVDELNIRVSNTLPQQVYDLGPSEFHRNKQLGQVACRSLEDWQTAGVHLLA